MFNATMLNIAERSTTFEDWWITGEQALSLIPADAEEIMDLMGCANKIRQRFKFRRVFKCGIVNVKSGLCGQDCAFCAQSAHSHQFSAPHSGHAAWRPVAPGAIGSLGLHRPG